MQNTLVIGCDSFLAKYYIISYLQKCSNIVTTSYKSLDLSFRYNLLDPNFQVLEDINNNNDIVYGIIFAGISNVLFCEKEKEYSYKCNVEGVLKTAEFFVSKNIIPIVFSSDYVFDGKTGNYTENSICNPLNEYGKHKAELEEKMIKTCENNCIIIRLSKVFDFTQVNNFGGEIISNLLESKQMFLTYDQIFSPINVHELINIILQLQEKKYRGIFNVGGKEFINRFDLSQKIIEKLKIKQSFIERLATEDLNFNVKIPKNITLNCQKLCSFMDIDFKTIDWYINRILDFHEK